jgi:hypothetical protein
LAIWQTACLEPYIEDGYIIIFRHDKNVMLPSFAWLRRMLFSLSRAARKGMRKLVLHMPTPACKERLAYLEFLLSDKAAKRIERTEDWRAHVPQESSTMIRAVLRRKDVGFDESVAGPEKRRKFEAEGLLYKKGKKSLIVTSSWKKRWARIDKEALYIYNTSHRPEVGTEPKSIIVLEGCVVRQEASKRQQHVLSLSLANPPGKVVLLAAKTDEEIGKRPKGESLLARSSLFSPKPNVSTR